MRIIIVYGGKSCESDISVITAITAYKAVKDRFDAELVYLHDGKFYVGKALTDMKKYHPFRPKKLREVRFEKGQMIGKGIFGKREKIDCALVCAHGGQGENGSLSGLFEIAEIPYTCCGVLQSAVCMDKVFTKRFLRSMRLPTLPFRSVCRGEETTKLSAFTYPVIIKPASLGSSIGISFAENQSQIDEKLNQAFQFDGKVLIESALKDFREFTCAIFRDEENLICGDIEEVVTPECFYDFREKYGDGSASRIYPAVLPDEMRDKMLSICEKIYSAMEMKGVVRIDFLEKNGKIYVNEINTVPGSLAWYLFRNKGYDLAGLIAVLIDEAIREWQEKEQYFTDFDSKILSDFVLYGKGGKGGKWGNLDGR